MTSRHSWGEPHRFPYKTERECLHGCDTIKVTRHEAGKSWVEYWRDGEKLGERAPVCERVRAET